MFDFLSGLFSTPSPDLSRITAATNVGGMGDILGNSMAGMNVSANYQLPQGPDLTKLGLLGLAMGRMGQQPLRSMPGPAPAPRLSAGGGKFVAPYDFHSYQPSPTAARLRNLLG